MFLHLFVIIDAVFSLELQDVCTVAKCLYSCKMFVQLQMSKGGKFLKKLRSCGAVSVGEYNRVI